MSTIDAPSEAVAAILRFPGRSVMTATGTILACAAYVATLGLISTLENQVSESFDVMRATEVRVRPVEETDADRDWQRPEGIAVVERLRGVERAGFRLTGPELPMSRDDTGRVARSVTVTAVDTGALDVIGPHVHSGRLFDEFHVDNAMPVVLLPRSIAEDVGIVRLGTAVYLDGTAFMLIGIFDDVDRRNETLHSALVPRAEDAPWFGGFDGWRPDLLISVRPGAGATIAQQAALAVDPAHPNDLVAIAPPDPGSLRDDIESDVSTIGVIVSIVALAIGAVSIGNAASAGIATRTAEIGVRRAFGARPRHVFTQLTIETALLGTIGGIIGVLLGSVTVVAIAITNGWVPVIDLGGVVVMIAASTSAGLIAGLAPALRAMRLSPLDALRR